MSYTQRTQTGHTPLTDTTPDGYTCGRVNEFVVIATSSDPYTIQWSAIGDPTSWPTPNTDAARAVQAGSQTFPNELGIVTGITSNEFYGYVLQEKGVTKMTYVGGDVVFSFDTFEEKRGCFEINRYVQVDDTIFYESKFGYHSLTDGQIANIGFGFVDDTYPPQKTVVPWESGNFPTIAQAVASNIAINCIFFESQNLVFNYRTGKWSRIPAIDGRSFYSVDSETALIGQASVISGVGYLQDSTGGTAQTATITTGEKDINEEGRTYVDSVRPLVDGGTVTARIGVRDDISTAVSWRTGTAVNTRTGQIHFRNADNGPPEGRYVRAEFTIADGFETALGTDVEWFPSGDV